MRLPQIRVLNKTKHKFFSSFLLLLRVDLGNNRRLPRPLKGLDNATDFVHRLGTGPLHNCNLAILFKFRDIFVKENRLHATRDTGSRRLCIPVIRRVTADLLNL
jgi:hypothetical protein